MSYDLVTFTNKVALVCMSSYAYATRGAELTAISTALTTDPTVHDKTIEPPPVATRIGPDKTNFTNEVLLIVNRGKAGNLSNNAMKTALTALAAAPPNPSPMVEAENAKNSGRSGKSH
jgi:hypothetical protein